MSQLQFDLITPVARYGEKVRRVVVLEHGELPSTDLYLAERMTALPAEIPVRYVDTTRESATLFKFAQGDYIIIVRYAPLCWMRQLAARQSILSGVVLLLDDDIPGALACADLPLRYALRTAWRYALGRSALSRLCHAVWVSTPYLQSKYANAHPRLLKPLYLAAPFHAKTHAVTYFYHGNGVHRLELDFLVGVVRQVQARLDNAHFEVIGNYRVKRMFDGIPRVRVQHPMPWADFLAYTSSVHHDVGLAPLLDSHFNRARSHNKLFDITRCGAAGIYSDVEVYRQSIEPGVTGILVGSDEDAWVDTICGLLTDQTSRVSMQKNALAWCEANSSDPDFTLA